MRCSILAMTGIAALTALAPLRAFAGDPEADKRIYDAFENYIKTVPAEKKAGEYQKFLEWYPTNIYAPQVKKEYDDLVASQTTPNNNSSVTNPNTSDGGFGISTNNPKPVGDNTITFPYESGRSDPSTDPMEEAAAAVGGVEDDAAAALGGEASAVPDGLAPTRDGDSGFTAALRRPGSFGIGVDFALSAFVGPGADLDYTSQTGHWTIGAGLRAPVFQSVQISLDARRFLTPERPTSAYLGGSIGGVYGNINNILLLIDQSAAPSASESATSLGALAGLQKITPEGKAYYLELSYNLLVTDVGDTAGFPGLSLGYRYFFR